MRRPLVALAIVGVLLAACGGSGDDSAGPTTTAAPASMAAPSTSPATTGAPDAASTVPNSTTPPPTAAPVDTTATPTTLPLTDDRIVVLAEEFLLADVLALGVQPIASSASVPEVGFQGLDEFDTSDIEVLPMTELNLEYLASLQPDVIITLQFWIDQIGEDVMRDLAELIIVPDALPMEERLPLLAGQLGRPAAAQPVLAALAEARTTAQAVVPDDCTVSLVAIYSGPSPAAFVDGPWDLPTAVLEAGCALDPDASVVEPDRNGRVYLSLEHLGLLDAATIVMLQSDAVEGEPEAIAEIEANPLWAALPAVQSGDVLVFDRLGYPGVTGQTRFFEDFAAAFA